jgi:resuscitation-promoting factor RpfC
MTLPSMAVGGVAKTMIAVTISLHPAAAHHGSRYITVRPGNTLSSISQSVYRSGADWPALWWANRRTVRNPSSIRVGQRLLVPSAHTVQPWLARAAVAAIPAPAPAPAAPAQAASTATYSATPAPVQAAATYSGASGSFQSCVIARESGGNAGAVNASSGAGGLYGFMPSTWQALGYSGLPQNASVATQNAAFAKEYAQAGGSPWSAYDGC